MTRIPAAHNFGGLSFSRRHMLAVLFEAQSGVCGICEQKMPPTTTARDQRNPMRPTVEHVLPLTCGGFDGRGNIVAAHSRCNGVKGYRYPTDAELAFLAKVNATMGWAAPQAQSVNTMAEADRVQG
jgi:hypothetical protein